MSKDKNDIKSKQNRFTNEDLKEMQKWDLEHKIAVSLTRISEFYACYPNQIYVLIYIKRTFEFSSVLNKAT